MTDPNIKTQIEAAIKEERRRIAREGGLARAKAMSKSELRESAMKASKAAALARKRKAKEREKQKKGGKAG